MGGCNTADSVVRGRRMKWAMKCVPSLCGVQLTVHACCCFRDICGPRHVDGFLTELLSLASVQIFSKKAYGGGAEF